MSAPKVNILLDSERLQADVLGLLSRIELRESDDQPSVCALRFNLRQRANGEFRPIDDDIFTPTLPIDVDLGAPGGRPTRLFRGYITHVRPHFEGVLANCYVEIVAMDAAVLLDAGDRVDSYPDNTDSEAVTEVFGRYDIAVDVQDTTAKHEEQGRLLVQRASDWRFIQRLARRNGFQCYLEYDAVTDDVVGHFHPRAVDGTAQADLAILQDRANLRWIDVQVRHTGPTAHIGAAIDPIAKRIVRAEGSRNGTVLGDTAVADANREGLEGAGAEGTTALMTDPIPLDGAIGTQGTGATDLDGYALEARGEIDNAAYRGLLRARRPVLIKGVGLNYSGTWYVRAVRTTLDQGALAQTFIAERNGWGLRGTEDFGQSAEEVEAQ